MSKRQKIEYPVIANKLKRLRKDLGYTQEEMARRIGLSTPGYVKYEVGMRSPSFTTLSRMVREFNLSIDWFYFDRGSMFFQKDVLSQKEALEQESKEQKEQLQQLRGQLEQTGVETDQLRGQLEEKELQLKDREQQLADRAAMPPEVEELVDQMAQIPLLKYEILAHFHRFKTGSNEN